MGTQAIDDIPRSIKPTKSQIEAVKQRKLSETGFPGCLLKLKIGAQMMLTANLYIEDRLVNGLVGKVMKLEVVNGKIIVKFE